MKLVPIGIPKPVSSSPSSVIAYTGERVAGGKGDNLRTGL